MLPEDYKDLLAFIKFCYQEISDYLAKLFLKLNDSKTEIILIGSERNVAKCKSEISSLKLGDSCITFSSFVKTLGVTLDETLSLEKHIQTISKNCMFRLRNLRQIRSHFDKSSFQIAVHATIISKLDYCNPLYAGLPSSSLRPLQLVQNFAARLILRRSKFCHITPLLHELHWLPIYSRIKFKVLLFVFKALHGIPTYLSSLLSYYQPTRSLRSTDQLLLKIPRTNKVSFGGRAFSVFGPKHWKTLPNLIKKSLTVDNFKKQLKTHLFSAHFNSIIF